MITTETHPYLVRIQAKHSGKFLDVLGQAQHREANVVQYDDNPGDQQRWLIAPVPGDPAYNYIIAKHSGKFLDVLGQAQHREANVGQWDADFGDQQRWKLMPQGNGYFKIQAKHSGKFLDVLGQSHENGANVVQYDDNPGDQQLWKFEQEKIPMPDLPPTEVFTTVRPHLEGTYRPKAEGTWYRVHREFRPFFAVKDDARTGSWKMQHSPFYVMEAHQRYVSKKEWYLDNQTSEVTQLEFTNTSGWSKTESTEFSSTTGITVSSGGSIGPVETSVELTQEFTHTTGTESGESGEKSSTISIPVGPGKTVAAWAVETKFVLRRMDESTVKTWTFHGGYLIDEYPDTVTAGIPPRLMPFLNKLEEALDRVSANTLAPEQAIAIAELARAATAVVVARTPE